MICILLRYFFSFLGTRTWKAPKLSYKNVPHAMVCRCRGWWHLYRIEFIYFFQTFCCLDCKFFFQNLIFIILKINSQSNSAFSEKKTYLRKSLKLGLPLLILLTFSAWLFAEGLLSNTLIPCLVISAALEISTNLSKVSLGALNKR